MTVCASVVQVQGIEKSLSLSNNEQKHFSLKVLSVNERLQACF